MTQPLPTPSALDGANSKKSRISAQFYPFKEQPLSDSCWSLHAGPDGRIYAAACVERTGGETVSVVRYNEKTNALDTLFDVDRVTGDLRDSGRATQCKIHYSFAPSSDGLLYAATHLSGPPKGERSYNSWLSWHDRQRAFRGAYLVAYDTLADKVISSELMIPKEGCRCLCLDEHRQRLYALTYPRDHLVYYDLQTRCLHDRGRISSVNSQCLFLDAKSRLFFTNDRGRFMRYSPDSDTLEELNVQIPHAFFQDGWHGVLYDALADPSGEWIYLLPWMARPRLMRYNPLAGPEGLLEDLGPVTQDIDISHPVSMTLDHAGGLVFGSDGALYYVRSQWRKDGEAFAGPFFKNPARGVLTRLNPATRERDEVCLLERPDAASGYVSRGARDRSGNLYFGHVGKSPVGLFRVETGTTNAEPPSLRMWG